jgi:hypothetical protein
MTMPIFLPAKNLYAIAAIGQKIGGAWQMMVSGFLSFSRKRDFRKSRGYLIGE